MRQQNEGKFIKEYSAICQKVFPPHSSFLIYHSSFPPPPFDVAKNGFPETPFVIESFFRPYGPGRKQVRPVIRPPQSGRANRYRETASDKGRFYRTEITGFSDKGDTCTVTARLRRGFRHQIRCHLAWTGCPVLNDPLYGVREGDGFLALHATGLVFTDLAGQWREYRIDDFA